MLAGANRSRHDPRLDELAPGLARLVAEEMERAGIAFTPQNYATLLAPRGPLWAHLHRLHDTRFRAAARQRAAARRAWAARLGLDDAPSVRARLGLSSQEFDLAEGLCFIRHVPVPYDLWDLGDTTGSLTPRYYPADTRLTAQQRTLLDRRMLRARLAAGHRTGGLLARMAHA
jgi:hypothetical protein